MARLKATCCWSVGDRLRGQFAKRWTYYIDPAGKIAFIDKAVKPATSGQDIVAKLGELNVPKRK